MMTYYFFVFYFSYFFSYLPFVVRIIFLFQFFFVSGRDRGGHPKKEMCLNFLASLFLFFYFDQSATSINFSDYFSVIYINESAYAVNIKLYIG